MPNLPRARFRRLLKESDAAATSDAQGAIFEEAICVMLNAVPGVEVKAQNVVSADGSEEIDIGVYNDKRPTGLPFMDYFVLVECKSSVDPVGSAQVGEFVSKLEVRAIRYGILVAAHGVTGGTNVTHANAKLAVALMKGIHVIVVTREELESLMSTSQVIQLFRDKLMELKTRKGLF